MITPPSFLVCLQPSTFYFIGRLFLVVCLLPFLLLGCAKKVTNNNPGQTLTITMTLGANANPANYRYFLVLNHDNTNLQGPDLSGKRTYTLPFDGTTTPGIGSPGMLDASSAPSFVYTDFFELSGDRGMTHGSKGNSVTPVIISNNFNSTPDTQVSISQNGSNITFSIPFDPLIQYFQIQLVTTNFNDYVVVDILDLGINRTGYHFIPNNRGHFESVTATNNTVTAPLVPAEADIRSCAITVN